MSLQFEIETDAELIAEVHMPSDASDILKGDTVTPETLLKDITAHDKNGEKITGTLDVEQKIKDSVATTLKNDTITAAGLLKDLTAHDASGEQVTGTLDLDAEKKQAIIDLLKNDTISASVLKKGYTGHDAQGDAITGTYEMGVAEYIEYMSKVFNADGSYNFEYLSTLDMDTQMALADKIADVSLRYVTSAVEDTAGILGGTPATASDVAKSKVFYNSVMGSIDAGTLDVDAEKAKAITELLKNDTVSSGNLLKGATAHDATGQVVNGAIDLDAEKQGTITNLLKNDTITADALSKGITAHDKDGNAITGTHECSGGDSVDNLALLLKGELTEYTDEDEIEELTYTFGFNNGIKKAFFPHLKTLGNYAFHYARNLEEIYAPNVTKLGNYALDFTCVTAADMPLLEEMGAYALQATGVTEAHYEKLTTTGTCVFYNCSDLESVKMPNVKTLGNQAFRACRKLTSLIFPSVGYISGYPFYNCSGLIELRLPALCQSNQIANNSLFYTGETPNLQVLELGAVSAIASNAFTKFKSLTDIYINAEEDSVSGAPWGAPSTVNIHWEKKPIAFVGNGTRNFTTAQWAAYSERGHVETWTNTISSTLNARAGDVMLLYGTDTTTKEDVTLIARYSGSGASSTTIELYRGAQLTPYQAKKYLIEQGLWE